MYMRGVFFVLLCMIVAASSCAAEWSAELSGSLGPAGFQQQLYVSFGKQVGAVDLRLGMQGDCAPGQRLQFTPTWRLEVGGLGPLLLRTGGNVDHYTSRELFRLISKNNHLPDTSFLILESEQLALGFFHGIPLRSEERARARFVESSFQLGPLTWRGLQLQYSSFQETGTAAVLQSGMSLGAWEAQTALGWLYGDGVSFSGRVLELTRTGSRLSGSFTWQRVEPGFVSLLAKSNRVSPNRVGWQLDLAAALGPMEAGLVLRRQTNLEGTRQYNRTAFTVEVGAGFSLEWRLDPTEALVLRRKTAEGLWQVDMVNQVVRLDRETERGSWSVRADVPRRIGRVEVQLEKAWAWRVVIKYDWLRQLSHCYLRLRWGGTNRYLQLELGQYDGGNLTAAFGRPPQLQLSWHWQF